MSTTSKEAHERAIFEHFLVISKLPVERNTIRLGDANHREPDIICRVQNLGMVGFELTRIAEDHFMEACAQPRMIERQMHKQLAELPQKRQTMLTQQYSNAHIGVAFAFERGFREVQTAVPTVFSLLESLPPGFSGSHYIDRTGRSSVIKWLSVTRSTALTRPLIYAVLPAIWLSDATPDAINAKLIKSYSSQPAQR